MKIAVLVSGGGTNLQALIDAEARGEIHGGEICAVIGTAAPASRKEGIMKIAVLVSGGGTNLQALIDAEARGEIHGGEICAVISSNPNAYALERAKEAFIPSYVLRRKEYDSTESYGAALDELLRQLGAGLVVLAGFMTVLPDSFCKAWSGKVMNIHPSLIPSFCGEGFYGLHVHEARSSRRSAERGFMVCMCTKRRSKKASKLRVRPYILSPRLWMAARLSCKRRLPSHRMTPPRHFSSVSCARQSGKSSRRRFRCFVKDGCMWRMSA